MRHSSLFMLIVLVCSSRLYGQVPQKLKEVLATKDFAAFQKYTNESSSDGTVSYWGCLRDLTTEIKEGVVEFRVTVRRKENPSMDSIYTYNVNLLTSKTAIIYYDLSEIKVKEQVDGKGSYFVSIVSFKNDSLYGVLKQTFKQIYQADLNERELFTTDIIYGESCGFAGIYPEARFQINEWVKSKNKIELLNWLRSTNTEKQIYAVDGLFQLKKLGVKFSEDEVKLINYVCKKSGDIKTCSGCFHHKTRIKRAARRFKQ